MGPTANTLSCVFSSYVSSIGVRLDTRKRSLSHHASNTNSSEFLIVSIPKTPGFDGLHGVHEEMAMIETILGSSVQFEELD